jgi:feruloyl esterase
MELWLPAQNWNGKFMGVGNGGFAGSIQGRTGDMPQALRLGYATAGTDTGHRTRAAPGQSATLKSSSTSRIAPHTR